MNVGETVFLSFFALSDGQMLVNDPLDWASFVISLFFYLLIVSVDAGYMYSEKADLVYAY